MLQKNTFGQKKFRISCTGSKVPFIKNIHNMPQGLPNPGFMQGKVQKGDFLKKPSRNGKKYFCLRIVLIPQTPAMEI